MDLGVENGAPFHLFEKSSRSTETKFTDYVKRDIENNILTEAFFSPKNIQIVKNGVRAEVYRLSSKQFVIAEPTDDDMVHVMREIFMENAKHGTTNITEQIAVLNNDVIQFCAPKIHGEAISYMKYRHDISTMAVPINHPQLASVKGGRQIERTFRDIGAF